MKHLSLTPNLYEYMIDKSLREHPSLTGLRKVTSTMELANMQVAPEQAQFMQLLLRLIHAKNVLELGTFTGYSALAMSLMLPDDGRLITCDINAEWTSKAHPFWKEAKQDHKIELRLGRALDTLHALISEGWEQKFDFIFIDADKTNYVNYYELALKLIQPQGLIAIDNIFWDGKVIDENETGGQTREIKKLNELIKNDQRVFISLLPIADGLFLVQPS
ncbi:TPA: class I SAM-dependent methyltransferase [Legionella anisa]|uniref:SAM-dependent methyltransferase n=1 Tax=Legionella anisa TaxID=28082 RepID=A0AAX0WWP8_9GAMM|nr:class I SAM-dependent methyltransferase [Legionella anisa]AWN73338.1 SAM-dependent methyltransferase [Legionella anisa]KTC69847.1 O-methyltransferase [Legionella anisa]MBN5934119.1 class I SAM-dependent methyltransferase [Legionella anisa]MCW8426198.1 class I SAM-dependent methyltransferase [Legionella anisa]MCW8447860.1 class I SAM-dependent methyltransferase [Legionella anisa]